MARKTGTGAARGKRGTNPRKTSRDDRPGAVYRLMMERDVDAAQHVHNLAFAKFFGVDPKTFRPESAVVRTRHRTDPACGYVADAGSDGGIRASVIVMNWGEVAVLGPLTVHPDDWSKGTGGALMDYATINMDMGGFGFRAPFRHAVLFTHPQSPGHIRLYQRHGFWPGSLSAVMSRTATDADRAENEDVARVGAMGEAARKTALAGCRQVAGAVFPGLDLTREIEGVAAQGLGETLVLRAGRSVRGFAICHFGRGSEARGETLYVKFAAVRPGDAEGFVRLVASCESLAAEQGLAKVNAGIATARLPAYRALLERGYRAEMHGVIMRRPAGPGWDLPDRFVIDDLR